jgi:dTMP kinase
MQGNYKGKFIAIEGSDFSGKGTQTMKALSYLYRRSKDAEFYITREPTMHTAEGIEIRRLLRTLKNPFEEAENLFRLYVEDRRKHLQLAIIPNLNFGIHVISDRYKYSTIAYQGAQGVSIEKMIRAHEGFLVPDLTLVFTLTIEEWEKRQSQDITHTEVFDTVRRDFTSQLLDNYSKMNEFFPNENIKIIRGTQYEEIIHEKVVRELEKILA